VASSLSSISEAPLPARLISVASVESSVLDTPVGVDEGKEIVTEAPVAPKITVIPPQSKEIEDIQNTAKVDETTSTNATQNVQNEAKNTAPEDAFANPTSDTLNNVMSDVPDNISNNTLGDVLSDKTAITDAAGYDQKQVEDTVVEGSVEDPPPPNEDTDHCVSHDMPQHHVSTSSRKLSVAKKQAKHKVRKRSIGSLQQRRKRNRKLSHQLPNADLAKKTFNKIGEKLLW